MQIADESIIAANVFTEANKYFVMPLLPRVNSKLYDFFKNDGRITVMAPKLW